MHEAAYDLLSMRKLSESELAMAVLERVYTVDDVRQLERQPLHPTDKYYLIDGELLTKMAPNQLHAMVAGEVSRLMGNFARKHGLGRVLLECGYHPTGDRSTVLLPDVSFESRDRMAQPPLTTYVPYMPDLAVEVVSPSQSMPEARRKAEAYLRHGVRLVWLLDPVREFAEVWRRGGDGAARIERVEADGELSGEDVLPGFRLALKLIYLI